MSQIDGNNSICSVLSPQLQPKKGFLYLKGLPHFLSAVSIFYKENPVQTDKFVSHIYFNKCNKCNPSLKQTMVDLSLNDLT